MIKRFLLLLLLALSSITSLPAWAQTCSYQNNVDRMVPFEEYRKETKKLIMNDPMLQVPHTQWPIYLFQLNSFGAIEKTALLRSSGDNEFDELCRYKATDSLVKKPFISNYSTGTYMFPIECLNRVQRDSATVQEEAAFYGSILPKFEVAYKKEKLKRIETKKFMRNPLHPKGSLTADVMLVVEATTGNVLDAWIYSSSCNKQYDELELTMAKQTQVFKNLPDKTIQGIKKYDNNDIFMIIFTSGMQFKR